MSVTESKAVSTTRKAAKNPKNAAQSAAVEQALANTPVEMVPLSQLALSPLNVRKVSPDPVKLQELADSIRAVGVLQNLIVHLLPDGLLGTAAGGRRFRALNILLNGGMITADYAVPVKTVTEEMAKIVSATENFQHEEMHPADQIAVFGEMSREGKTAAQIAGVLGYSTKHVQKFLRLAGMAPALLAALAEDKLNVDQLQALSASEDQERQLNVWENAFGYYRNPKELREAVLKGEVPAAGNRLLDFVGREAYEQAGGGFRYDLFSDEGFIGDTVLLHTVARQKLTDIAAGIAQAEGWLWSEGRTEGVSTYGEDAERYLLLKQPAGELTPEERARFDALGKQLETLSEQDDDEDADHDALELAADDKTGVNQHLSSIRTEGSEEESAQPQAKPLSAALVKSLSSERTLAVQAALAAQPQMALVIFVHDCLKSTFTTHSYTASTLKVSLHAHTGNLLDNAPTANDGLAMQHLNAMHEAWQAQLPDNWHESWDWLLKWDTQQLISVMGYCLAKTLNGASERLSHKDSKAGKELEPVEAMLGFTLRDWWLPTKANFFGRISKEQISDSLSQAGLDGAARDALKMKKAEAAELAEDKITLTSWVPECLMAVCEQPDAGTDTDTHTAAAIAA